MNWFQKYWPFSMALILITVVVSIVMFDKYMHPVLAQNYAGSVPMMFAKAKAQKSAEAQAIITMTPVTVNLPPGQRFMYIIPAEDAERMKIGEPGKEIYVAYEYKEGFDNEPLKAYRPRKITFWQPGGWPGTWQGVLNIQER